jgi:LysR substrate binding domain
MFGALYDFCRDQGSIIGGLLVLAAGFLVFSSVRHAADRQVAAVNAQTEAVRQQNRDLRDDARRRQARDAIVALKLLASILAIIRNDVDRLKQLLEQTRYVERAGSPGHPQFCGSPGTASCRCLVHPQKQPIVEGHCLRDQSVAVCDAVGLGHRRDDAQAAGLESLRQMVMAGIGIALVPELATRAPFGASQLAVYRRFAPPEPTRELVLAWRRSFPRGDALQGLARGLREALTSQADANRSVRS